MADALGCCHVVHAVVVEAGVEEVTVILVLDPHGRPSVLTALIGLWRGLQSGSWVRMAQAHRERERELRCRQ